MPGNKVNWLSLFHQFPKGIGVLESSGRIIYGNDRLKTLFRKEGDSLTLRNETQRAQWERFFKSFLKGREGEDQLIITIPDQLGRMRWYSIKLIRGSDSMIFLLDDDVTDEQLYREELKQARDDAEKATRTKSEFLANMSHEIRTPIHTIIGMSELMNLTKLDQEQDEYSSQIRFSADVLLSLINDILDFSKIEAGQMELEITGCNLLDIMEESVDLIALEAHKKGVEVGLYAEPGLDFQVEGDPTRLRQIIVNLCNNAVKFTHEGQVMVFLRKEDSRDADIERIRVSVTDSGIGIPDSKKHRLFEAFTQADSSTTRQFGGTGLGLTICKNLVAQMGGDLQVESREGEGSEFHFTLDFKRVYPELTVPEALEYGEDLKGRTVLLADDNIQIREALSLYLQRWGCTVELAGSGKEALDMLHNKAGTGKPYDLCIADQLMPEMDAWQMASQIHADDSVSGTPLIMMSLKGGRGTEEAKMKLLGWFSAYMTKPVRKQELWDSCFLALYPEKVEPGELEELEELEEIAAPAGSADAAGRPAVDKSKKDGLILIAEDHPVNRKLFESILTKQGYSVILAENGQIAVEKALSERPDLIFMDCQMPVMNGYEATRSIREEGLKIPVIAVTANAIRGEQEKCFHAGMNDFLPKPFKNQDLLPVLDNWLKPQVQETEDLDVLDELEEMEGLDEVDEVLEEIPEEDADMIEEAPVFDFKQAMDTFMDDKELLISLLEPYMEQVEGQMEELTSPGILDNPDKVRSIAHSIKGSSRNLSMLELGNEAEILEHAGRDKKRDVMEGAVPEVAAAFERVKEAVQKVLNEES